MWFAPRLPQWMTPDVLTGIGIGAAVLIAAGYILTVFDLAWLWLANAGLVIHWFGDSLDGTVARYRKIERPKFGFFIDHFADALSMLIICAGMGLSPILNLHVSLSLIVGYSLLMILVYLVTIVRGEFKISFARVGPTEVRMIILAANIIVWALGNPGIGLFGYDMKLFTLLGIGVSIGFGLFFFVSGFIELNRLKDIDKEQDTDGDVQLSDNGAPQASGTIKKPHKAGKT